MQTIYLAGDSTAAIKLASKRPETGWGEYLAEFIDPQKFIVDNRAMNGRSTKSFIHQGRLAAIEQVIKPNDYLFIQFGHNDQKLTDPERGTQPFADYQVNLEQFITVARSHQAIPVLLTSLTRRKYLPNQAKIDPQALGEYPAAMKQVATTQQVTLLDINQISRDYFNQLSPEQTRQYFMNFAANLYANYPQGSTDNTHLRPAGAKLVAMMITQAILDSNLSLKESILETKIDYQQPGN